METEVVTTTVTTTTNKVVYMNSEDAAKGSEVSANGETGKDEDGDTSKAEVSKVDLKSLLPRIKAKVLQPGEDVPSEQGIKTMMVINKDGTKTVLTVVPKSEVNDSGVTNSEPSESTGE